MVAGANEEEEEEVEAEEELDTAAATRLDLSSVVSAPRGERIALTFDLLNVPLGDADAPDREWRASSVGREQQEGSGTTRHLLDDDDDDDDGKDANAEKRWDEELAETARMVGWCLILVFRCVAMSLFCSGSLAFYRWCLERGRGREREKQSVARRGRERRRESTRRHNINPSIRFDPLPPSRKKESHFSNQPLSLLSRFCMAAAASCKLR